MKFFYLFYLFIFSSYSIHSQIVKPEFLPSNKDSLIKYISDISEKKIKKLASKNNNEVKKIIIERKQEFIKNLNDSSFIFNKAISNYLSTILKEIYSRNLNINHQDFYFFIDKSPIPNAACYGNGIFTINIGLFNFVNSDDELAYVICHEISHYILEHNDKSLLSHIENLNSKENKKRLNQLKNQEYGRRKAYSDFMEKINFNFLKRSRTAETQADSLGYILFSKTKYNKISSVKSLQNLNLSDELVFNEDSKLKEHFNFENYPFKESWLLKDQNLFDVKTSSDDYTSNKDSLKTHPDMPLRIDYLNKLISDKEINVPESTEKLKEIKKLIGLLTISYFLDENRIDFALYKTLVLYNKKEINQETYCVVVSSILKKVYELKLNHQFGKYVSHVSPFSDEENLNQVKLFLHNIELKNIKKIGFYFCLQHQETIKNNPKFIKVTDFFNNLNTKT